MDIIPASTTCPGHSQAEIDTLVDHICAVYKRFYVSQLATLNANWPEALPITIIEEGDEEPLDQLSYYDLGPAFSSWTLPPYPLLGTGAYRVAIGLCDDHALKVNPGAINHNAFEAATWSSLPDHLRSIFVPVLAVAPGPEPSWLIAQRAQPLLRTPDNDYLAQQIDELLNGIEDIGTHQLGRLHGALVLLDYGHDASDLSALSRQFPDPSAPLSLFG